LVRSLTSSSTTSATVLEITLAVCSTWNLAAFVNDTPFKGRAGRYRIHDEQVEMDAGWPCYFRGAFVDQTLPAI
jgi:hypothetical protein